MTNLVQNIKISRMSQDGSWKAFFINFVSNGKNRGVCLFPNGKNEQDAVNELLDDFRRKIGSDYLRLRILDGFKQLKLREGQVYEKVRNTRTMSVSSCKASFWDKRISDCSKSGKKENSGNYENLKDGESSKDSKNSCKSKNSGENENSLERENSGENKSSGENEVFSENIFEKKNSGKKYNIKYIESLGDSEASQYIAKLKLSTIDKQSEVKKFFTDNKCSLCQDSYKEILGGDLHILVPSCGHALCCRCADDIMKSENNACPSCGEVFTSESFVFMKFNDDLGVDAEN